jgi:hypothetical protein
MVSAVQVNDARSRHPVRRRPALVGAGHRPGRHVNRTLTGVRALAVRAVVCSARPGSMADGMASSQPPTDREPRTVPRHSGARAPPPEAKNQTYYGARLALWRGVPVTPRPQLIAGRLPASIDHMPWALPRSSAALRASRCPRQPMGVGLVAVERQRRGDQAPDRRRVRPVSGRLESPYGKYSQIWILARSSMSAVVA